MRSRSEFRLAITERLVAACAHPQASIAKAQRLLLADEPDYSELSRSRFSGSGGAALARSSSSELNKGYYDLRALCI